MNIKDEIFEAYGEMKAEQDLLAVGYTALLGTSMAAKSGEAALLNRFSARYVRECRISMRNGIRLRFWRHLLHIKSGKC